MRLIIPLPPGSGTDIAGRMLAERLAERWGQPVVVENRQGADGIPAVTSFLAARDNHTLLFSFAGVVTMNTLLHDHLPYDPRHDLVPVVPVLDAFLGVSATASLNVATLADLVRVARAQPGKINWAATPGLPYYILLALQRSAGLDMVQVSYRDFAPAYQDLAQGRLHVAATGVQTLVPHHQAGTARLLIVTNRERTPQVPDVPTAAEAGFPDLTFEGTIGIFGWRDIPSDISERIASDVRVVVAEPAFRRTADRQRRRAALRQRRRICRRDRGAARKTRRDPSGDRRQTGAVTRGMAARAQRRQCASRSISLRIASPISRVPTSLQPSDLMSAVRSPLASVAAIAGVDHVGGLAHVEGIAQRHAERSRSSRSDWRCPCRRCRAPSRAPARTWPGACWVFGIDLAERGRRQHAERAGEHRGHVGEHVAEQVVGDDHVKLLRPAHELHAAGVGKLMLKLHVLELARHAPA